MKAILIAATLSSLAGAVNLDTSSPASIKSVSKSIATSLSKSFDGSGLLAKEYSFGETAVAYDSLIQYFFLTGDEQFNGLVRKGLLAQKGGNEDFVPANQSGSVVSCCP